MPIELQLEPQTPEQRAAYQKATNIRTVGTINPLLPKL